MYTTIGNVLKELPGEYSNTSLSHGKIEAEIAAATDLTDTLITDRALQESGYKFDTTPNTPSVIERICRYLAASECYKILGETNQQSVEQTQWMILYYRALDFIGRINNGSLEPDKGITKALPGVVTYENDTSVMSEDNMDTYL
jgi:hypothetical protein